MGVKNAAVCRVVYAKLCMQYACCGGAGQFYLEVVLETARANVRHKGVSAVHLRW